MSTNQAVQGKRKPPPPGGSATNKGTGKKRKRRKAGVKPAAVSCSSGNKRTETFYYCETNDDDPQESLCNLLIQKRLTHPSEATTHERPCDAAAAAAAAAAFEYTSGTDVNGSIYRSGGIEANETNVLVRGLTRTETNMWSSSLGANYASKGFAPSNIARTIGTITRRLYLPCDTTTLENQIQAFLHDETMTKTMKWSNAPNAKAKATPPSLARVKKELRNDSAVPSIWSGPGDLDEEFQEEYVLATAQETVDAWKRSLASTGKILPNWNAHGEIPMVPVVKAVSADETAANDKSNATTINTTTTNNNNTNHTPFRSRSRRTASVVMIRAMLESKVWADDTLFAPAEKELYHLRIPNDTLCVLKALEALAKPDEALYGIPLVLAIPVLEPIDVDGNENEHENCNANHNGNANHNARSPWRLTISIYTHRLLFECMTADSLRTVMAALDDEEGNEKGDDSSCMARPLVKSPAVGPIVFGKDPKTKIEMVLSNDVDDDDDTSVIAIDGYGTDEGAGEERRTRTDDTLDAFSTEGFLKLIENQGVSGIDTIYQNKIEPVLYRGDTKGNIAKPLLQVSLLPHQIHGVCWMYQMETLDEGENNDSINFESKNPSLGLNGLLWERRRFHEGDTYYYSPALGQARLTIGNKVVAGKKQRGTRGGILADEMGLGKTVQALALVLATLNDLRKEKDARQERADVGHRDVERWNSHATLIIVPPALVGQWLNEIRKIAGDNLRVQFLDGKNQNQSLHLDSSADIVVATYQSLESKGKKASRKPAQARGVSRLLSTVSWGRIILDEMQEVRSWNTSISKACQELKSDRRWMLSGTPLWEGIQDFKGELCFLGLEPFAANNEDGFFDFAIANHWEARSKHGLEILRILGLVMLRRTKSMNILESGLPLLGLKNLTLVFEPVPQDPPERAMYCFLESVMHSTLMQSDEAKNEKKYIDAARKTKKNRLIFLRLLRELCVSLYLINGGVGCSSQLSTLNRLMKEYNRNQLKTNPSSHSSPGHGNDRFYSCDEAIQFLSQVEDMARTDSDFVTDTRLGGGGGISRRNRALLINPQERVDSAREQIVKSTDICRAAQSSRAKVRWQWALEGVTTGRLVDKSCYTTASSSLVRLWDWRNRVAHDESVMSLSFLKRGFRPTEKYFGLTGNSTSTQIKNTRGINNQQHEREEKLIHLGKRRPEFRWAHPFAVMFLHIPIQVSEMRFQKSIEHILELVPPPSSASSSSSSQIFRVRESVDSKTWEAIVQFSNGEEFDRFEKHVKKVDGVPVKLEEKLPCIEQEIAAAACNFHDADAMWKVHPCDLNEQNLTKAKAAYKKSKLGLRILAKAHHRSGQVLCSRAFGNFRGTSPKTWEALDKAATKQIEEATCRIIDHTSILYQQERTIKSMQNKIKLNVAGTGAENLNTIDVLQALKNDESDKTNCPICYDNLGDGEDSNGKVLLTRCGHLSCRSCLRHWIDRKEAQGTAVTCIECRKPIIPDQLICVDPKKVDKAHLDKRKKKANILVQQAAKMLEENYGQLEPHLWEALYLVIDLPPGIDRNRDGYFTAIPGLFLGHLRHAMGKCQPIQSAPNQRSMDPNGKIFLPSKVRALLADLPRNELSVVFASSKSIVLHLESVLENEGFGCKTLFVGQSEQESESAVSDWESYSSEVADKAATVLIVQAGAAACGLTLTAASQMFIIEPFRKHEEEKQAYARLHRFGQKKAVSCKVYYAPVSVESRLLEWRRRATTHAPDEEKTVYAPLRQSHDNDDDCASRQMMEDDDNHNADPHEVEDGSKKNSNDTDDCGDVAEENQTRFLLGLTTSSAVAETTDETI